MIKIISNIQAEAEMVTTLQREHVKRAAQKAMEAIKAELPENACTVEVIEYVISEMGETLKTKNIIL